MNALRWLHQQIQLAQSQLNGYSNRCQRGHLPSTEVSDAVWMLENGTSYSTKVTMYYTLRVEVLETARCLTQL